MSDSMGTKEASEKWGYSQNTISKWCREGLIEGADQDSVGSPWHIPKERKVAVRKTIMKERLKDRRLYFSKDHWR